MAKYENGIHGPFSGKVGQVVGASWKGIPYFRSLPKKRTGKISNAEAANRQRFALAHQWLKPLLPFVRLGYKGYSERVEGFLAAKSYLLHHAMALHEGVWEILPEEMLLSYGTLSGPKNATVNYVSEQQELIFTWDNTSLEPKEQQDQTMLLAYQVSSGRIFFQTTGAFRKTGEDRLTFPLAELSEPVLVYMAFVSGDRLSQSNSEFMGAYIWG
jgi:hypothetical protein